MSYVPRFAAPWHDRPVADMAGDQILALAVMPSAHRPGSIRSRVAPGRSGWCRQFGIFRNANFARIIGLHFWIEPRAPPQR